MASSQTAPRKRRVYRLAEIKEAAIRLFCEKGFAETSMEEVGAAVGIAGPSIYRHFASKMEIVESALADAVRDFWAHFEHALEEDDPEARLDCVVSAVVDWFFEHPMITAVSMQVRPRLSDERRITADREDRRLVSLLVDALGAARPRLDRHEAKLLVRGAIELVLTMALARTSLGRQRAKAITKRAALAVLVADED